MWAEIDEQGTLTIIPETPCEAFALGVWKDGQKDIKSKYMLRIVRDIEKKPARAI